MNWVWIGAVALIAVAILVVPLVRPPAEERRAARFAMVVLAVIVPLCSVLLYLGMGAPGVADKPFAHRLSDPDFALMTEGLALSNRLKTAPDAAGFVRLGEIRVELAGGRVTPEAAEAFARALSLEPQRPEARFFAGLALAQGGQREKALAVWRALEKDSDPSAPWMNTLRQSIVALEKN